MSPGRILAIFLLVCSLFGTLSAQQIVRGRGRFLIDVDYSRYYGDDKQVYVEMYYGIHESSISYAAGENGLTGGVKMRLIVKSKDSTAADKEWLVPHQIPDSSRMSSTQIMTGIESLALPLGAYGLHILAADINDPARRDSFYVGLDVVLFPKAAEATSDIELCTMIQSSTNKQSIFYKNTLEVTPNPARLFGVGLPIMYYYLELYNLSASGSATNATLRTTVINAAGKEVIAKDKPKARTLNSSVEIGTVNLSALKQGTYMFRVDLLDTVARKTLASTSKKFFIYKPGSGPDSSLPQGRDELVGSAFAVMTEEEATREIEYIGYIATAMEQRQIVTLGDLPAKQRFLFEFWKRRDAESQGGENLVRREYLKRVDYADRTYAGGMRKGWKGDRGRVYILYAAPDEIERFPNTTEANPYEIWHYDNIQGGIEFDFVDRNAMGDYALVNSTHRDELHNLNWFQDYASKAH